MLREREGQDQVPAVWLCPAEQQTVRPGIFLKKSFFNFLGESLFKDLVFVIILVIAILEGGKTVSAVQLILKHVYLFLEKSVSLCGVKF